MNRHLSEKQVNIRAVSVLFIITRNLLLSEILDNRLIFRLLGKLLHMLALRSRVIDIFVSRSLSIRAINNFIKTSIVNSTKIIYVYFD